MGNYDWEFNALDELRKRIDKMEYERIRKQKEWADGEAREKAQDEARAKYRDEQKRAQDQKERERQTYGSGFGRNAWGYAEYSAEDYARASSGWFGQDQQPRSRAQEPSAGIPQDKLLELIKLCHPDKHANSPAATEITKWLLAQRKG